jgi:DGQHR domain-containing protein
MEINKASLKDFKRRLKSIENDFERNVGEVIVKLVGNIDLFPVELHYHREIQFEDEKMIPDYFIKIKNRDAEHVIIIELKDYENISNVLPQLDKFYAQLEKLRRDKTYFGIIFHPLFVIRSEDKINDELNKRSMNLKIPIEKADLFTDLDKSIEKMNPQYAFLDFLKNTFNMQIAYEGKEFLELEAVENHTFGVKHYTFVMPARDLLKLAYVYRASVDKETQRKAYQRTIDGDRLSEIKKFITAKTFTSVFPNNIICTFGPDSRNSVTEVTDSNLRQVRIENKYSALWIIDGQHRLFSLTKLSEKEQPILDEYRFLVTSYKDISPGDQAKIFSSINNEQVGINPNLIFYILSQLLEDKEGVAAKVALELQSRHQLFDSEIYCGIEGRYKNWLNLKTFVDNLTPSKEPRENLIDWNDGKNHSKGWLQKQPEYDKNDLETPIEVLAMYFNCIKETFPTDWKKGRTGFFQSNPGIAVSLRLLLKILTKECSFKNPDGPRLKKSDFYRYLRKFSPHKINKKIPDLEIDEWRRARNKSQYNRIFEYIWSEIS